MLTCIIPLMMTASPVVDRKRPWSESEINFNNALLSERPQIHDLDYQSSKNQKNF